MYEKKSYVMLYSSLRQKSIMGMDSNSVLALHKGDEVKLVNQFLFE